MSKKEVTFISHSIVATLDSVFLSIHAGLGRVDLRLRGAAGVGGRAGLESVLEAARDVLEVPHAAGAGGLPPLRLLAPVDCVPSVSCVFPKRNLSIAPLMQGRSFVRWRAIETYTSGS